MGAKPGQRFGGRKKGTPNKLTRTAQEQFLAHKVDPLHELLAMAKQADAQYERLEVVASGLEGRDLAAAFKTLVALGQKRERIMLKLIEYKHPKLSTTTIEGNTERPLNVTLDLGKK